LLGDGNRMEELNGGIRIRTRWTIVCTSQDSFD
jgi:hypothetical protein